MTRFEERYLESSTIPKDLPPEEPYRYMLKRVWDFGLPRVFFVGLNPSTATAEQDDPTIRREYGFAKSWGCGGFLKANICAFRSTDPMGLRSTLNPYGPLNDEYIAATARAFADQNWLVVAAWGALSGEPKWLHTRAEQVLTILRKHSDVHAIRITAQGMPEHPLYLPKNLAPVLYRARSVGLPV